MAQKIRTNQLETVAFRARRTSSRNVGTSFTSLDCDNIEYDTHSAYTVSGGVFTAPYSGIYSFTVSIYGEGATTDRILVYFVTSGTGVSPSNRAFDVQATRVRRASAHWQGYIPAGGTMVAQAYSGSTIDISNNDTWFAGHLIART